MFDAISQDPSLVQLTLIFTILVAIAIWRKLFKVYFIIAGIYVFYTFYIFVSESSNKEKMINNYQPKEEINYLSTKIVEEDTLENVPLMNDDHSPGHIKNEVFQDTSSSKKQNSKIKPITDESKVNVAENKNLAAADKKSGLVEVLSMDFGRVLNSRELLDVDSSFSLMDDRIYTLTKISNRDEKAIFYHNWYHEGKLKSKIKMEVGRSYSWRTWSYINVEPSKLGKWKVIVSDSRGIRYDSLSFQIQNTRLEME